MPLRHPTPAPSAEGRLGHDRTGVVHGRPPARRGRAARHGGLTRAELGPARRAPDEHPDQPVEQGEGEHREELGLHPETVGEHRHADDQPEGQDDTDGREGRPLLTTALAGHRDAHHPGRRPHQQHPQHRDHPEEQQREEEAGHRLHRAGRHALGARRVGDGVDHHHLGDQGEEVHRDEEATTGHRDRRGGTRRPGC